MYAILAFDTEDIYFPSSYGVDDIPGWLASIMTECGIRGTFFVMGEKARSMKARGRTEVLTAMAQHDIGSHQQGNCRPLIPEITAGLGWDEGVRAMHTFEDRVKQDHCEAFGSPPVSLSRHNCYFAPQHVAAASQRGLPYMYGIAAIPGYDQPTWYAGTLTFTHGAQAFGGFDTLYTQDDEFDRQFAALERFTQDALTAKREYITVFGCHPCRVMTAGWQETHILAGGGTRSPRELGWLYGVKSKAQEARARENFRKLCTYLAGHPDIEVVGISEAARHFSTQPGDIPRDVLTVYADTLDRERKPVTHLSFSPAELVCGLARSIVHHAAYGDVPDRVERCSVLGPVTRPGIAVEKDALTHSEITALSHALLAVVQKEGRLPANLETDGGRVGLGQFTVLAGRAYRALARYEQYAVLRNEIVPRYPDEAFAVGNWIRRCLGEHWAMPLDLDLGPMTELAMLQAWTLKPAWLRPPLGPSLNGARILQPVWE